ncbi:hypothetical protein ACS0TY_033548 [Phlomoides rotata]
MLPFLRCLLKKYSQFNIWDVVATLVCLTGVTLAYFADSQLHNFVCRNQRLKILGQELVPNLDEGLWNYSCHPNYFGEQLWWWGLAIFAWNLDCRWSFIGTFINHLCLAYVTVLVEEYMLKQEYRAEAYKKYLIQSHSLYFIDYIASLHKLYTAAFGYGSYFVLSMMDRHYRRDMTVEEAIELVDTVIMEIWSRLVIAPPNFVIKIVDKDGAREYAWRVSIKDVPAPSA